MAGSPVGCNSVLASDSVLGRFGTGAPAGFVASLLAAEFGPARVLARGCEGLTLPPGTLRLLRPAAWRRLLAGTRLHRLQERGQKEERLAFDRWAAGILPPCRVAVLENSTSLATLRRARESGARVVLGHNNHSFRSMMEDVREEERRWGGPPFFVDAAFAERTAAEAREADLVFGMSDSVLESLRRDGVDARNLRRARYGVDAERFRPSPRRREAFNVAFVGWLDLRKGYPYLVEAFRDAAIPGSSLLLHGGTGVAYHHGLVERLRGSADVRVVRGPVEETYSNCGVTVLPSVSDAFGHVVLESMASGVPPIVTDRCGAAEIVTDGVDGFVVPARDSGAIRRRIQELHGDPRRREAMGVSARQTALRHPWSRFVEDVRGIVAEALRPG